VYFPNVPSSLAEKIPDVDVVRLYIGLCGGRGEAHVLVAREMEHAGGTLARRPRVGELRAVARGAVPALAARAPVLARAFGAGRRLRLAAGEDRTCDGIFTLMIFQPDMTRKKGYYRFSRPQIRCHLPNSFSWQGII
jgi:hypothetical protein